MDRLRRFQCWITYDSDALKLIDDLHEWRIGLAAVVITRYENQPSATIFQNKLERRNAQMYTHLFTKGYPTDYRSLTDMGVNRAGFAIVDNDSVRFSR
jgi:uncharacterized protein (UPF0371 family)